MREWLTRVVDWLRRDRLDRELQEELRFHEQQLTHDAAGRGVGPDAARQYARTRLGSVQRVREESRDRWSLPSLEHLLNDIRHAGRSLRHAPAFTAAVVVTLSLGLGANAAMFDITDRLMFRPLAALRDPDTVHRVYMQTAQVDGVTTFSWVPFERYQDFQRWTSSFSEFAAISERQVLVGSGDEARERRIAGVTASYFDLFAAPPVRGRYFSPGDDTAPIGASVAVISHELWQNAFGARDVIGAPLQIGSLAATIIGVAHPAHAGVTDTMPAAVFVPITAMGPVVGGAAAARWSTGYGSFWGDVLVRRRPGVSLEQASADVDQAFRRSYDAQRAAEPNGPTRPTDVARPTARVASVRPGAGPNPSLEVRTALWVSGVAVVVLLIACANVANLVLGRAVTRAREVAVRAALGAGRTRLLTHALAESLLLAAMSAVGALALATVSAGAILAMLVPGGAPSAPASSIRTLSAVGGAACAISSVLGLVPALAASRTTMAASLRVGPRTGHAHRPRLRAALVIAQTALSVVLLVGAVLFVRSLNAVRTMPLGYDADRVLLVNSVVRGATLDAASRMALRRRLIETAEALPGVTAVSWRSSTPLGLNAQLRFSADGIPSVGELGQFTAQEATGGYFEVMGTRILHGRGLSDGDTASAPRVVVVSEGMAARLWPDADPLGKCLRFGNPATAPCTAVVGVAEDIVQSSVTAEHRFHYYLPIDQTSPAGGAGLALRVAGNPAHEADRIRRALQPLMPGTSYLTTQPLADLVSRAHRSWRLGATMFMALGLLAVVVAAVGLFSLIRYSVTQRAHELGVRSALGASRADILRLVIGQNVRFAVTGIAAGIGLAILASSQIEPLLFRQSATDPGVYALVGMLMIAVALGASATPAIAASRTPPIRSLRAE